MKLAHLTWLLSAAGGGIPTIALSLAQAQRKAGHYVRAFGVKDPTAGPIETTEVECHRSVGPVALGMAPGLGRALGRANPEVLHLHGLFTWPSQVASTWGFRTKRPVIVAPHGMLEPWALSNSAWKKRVFRWLIEDKNLRRAACLHVGSVAEADNVRRLNLSRPMALIPNGVDTEDADRAPDAEAFARNVPKLKGRRVLLFMSRIHPKKGLMPLLDAWASLKSEREEWSLVIAGPDQLGHSAEVAARVQALGLDRDVELVGPLYGAEKTAALAGAQTFVLPSFSEGFAMAVLEAMAFRLPVLITHGCNLDVEAFGGGLLAEPTPESLGARLRDLLSLSETERQAMGARGRAEVDRKYTWPKVAAQFDEVYAWLLGGGARPGNVELT